MGVHGRACLAPVTLVGRRDHAWITPAVDILLITCPIRARRRAMDQQKSRTRPKLECLELNRETVQDLTEGEAEAAQGGILPGRGSNASCNGNTGCDTNDFVC